MNLKFDTIFFALFSFLALINLFWIVRTEKRLKKFFSGKKARDLEDTILSLQENISKLSVSEKKIESELLEINKKIKKSIRGIETIRFNPFHDQGSNQSFAVGMLNEDGDGVVFSSLYSRDRMSMFAKPIKNGTSDYELTEEEKEVLNKAKI